MAFFAFVLSWLGLWVAIQKSQFLQDKNNLANSLPRQGSRSTLLLICNVLLERISASVNQNWSCNGCYLLPNVVDPLLSVLIHYLISTWFELLESAELKEIVEAVFGEGIAKWIGS